MELLATYFSRLRQRSTWRWQGRVLEAVGQTIESSGPLCSVGECCEILDGNGEVLARSRGIFIAIDPERFAKFVGR